jgi:hypothetical protein
MMILAALLLAAAPGPPVQAGPAPDQRPVARAELESLNTARFDQMDTDKDGFLSPGEITATVGPQKSAATLVGLDVNGDSKVTLAELSSRMLAIFDFTDTNHDGVVTLEERAALRATIDRNRPPGSAQ